MTEHKRVRVDQQGIKGTLNKRSQHGKLPTANTVPILSKRIGAPRRRVDGVVGEQAWLTTLCKEVAASGVQALVHHVLSHSGMRSSPNAPVQRQIKLLHIRWHNDKCVVNCARLKPSHTRLDNVDGVPLHAEELDSMAGTGLIQVGRERALLGCGHYAEETVKQVHSAAPLRIGRGPAAVLSAGTT